MKLAVDYSNEICFAIVDIDINIQGDTKKRELLKNPTKIEEIQEKNIIDGN